MNITFKKDVLSARVENGDAVNLTFRDSRGIDRHVEFKMRGFDLFLSEKEQQLEIKFGSSSKGVDVMFHPSGGVSMIVGPLETE